MAIVIFEHSDLSGSDRLGETLRDHGHQLRVLRLHAGDAVPSDLGGVDGVVSCGGGSGVRENPEYLEPECAFLRNVVDAELPVVGICLGNQMLAHALGGTIDRMEGGIEAGWHTVELTPVGREDPIHAGIAWSSIQPHWHRDAVTELPAGARLLSKSERCPVQAWALGLRTYGFQYHPEIFPGTMDGWAADEPAALTEVGTTREKLQAETDLHYPTCARLADRLFDSIALMLMPIDRRYAGIARDLHH